jgi:outer membrane protein TolC
LPITTTESAALGTSGAAAPPAKGAHAPNDAAVGEIVDRMISELTRGESEPRRMSLAEAVQAAVQNNPGIRSQAEVANYDAWTPFGATGAFDPLFQTNAIGSRLKQPSASALSSGKPTLQEDAVRGGASISKLLRSGGLAAIDWETQVVNTNSIFYEINPRYDNRLTLSLRQPLLRNFLASGQTTTVLVARSEAEEALASFEANLSRFVSDVIAAYWTVVADAAQLEVNRRSVALARELVRDAEAKVNVGLLAPVAVKEALADAASREEKAIEAENALTVAARDLQYKVMFGAAENKAPLPIQPVEEHVVTPIDLDRAATLKTAVESRAEIRGATAALGRRHVEEKDAKSQRLWDLDLVGHYSFLGLRGDARPIVDANGNVHFSQYNGDYDHSLDDMFGTNYFDYGVGLQLSVPFGNASGRASLAQAEINVRGASRDFEQTVSSVALDVDRAIADVDSSAKRVAASKAARDLAEENVRNQSRRFELGAVTTKDVLDYQERLAEAQAAEVRAITDHALSVARLRLADGTLLSRFGVEIETPDAPGKPWWFRF